MTERKKTLLKEGTIRRFMKLAELDTLSSNFLNHYELEEQDEEPTPEEAEFDAAYEEEGEEEGFEAAEAEATPEDMVQDLVTQIADVISNVTGVEVSVDGDEGEVEDVEGMDNLDDLAADEEVMDMAEPDLPGDELAEDKDWGKGKDEYRRKKGPDGVEHKAGEGPEGHYKDYEGKYGGGKGEKSATHPGEEDYTTKKGMKKKTGPGKAYQQQEESLRLGHVDLIDDEALVQEIAQRVAQRLTKK